MFYFEPAATKKMNESENRSTLNNVSKEKKHYFISDSDLPMDRPVTAAFEGMHGINDTTDRQFKADDADRG